MLEITYSHYDQRYAAGLCFYFQILIALPKCSVSTICPLSLSSLRTVLASLCDGESPAYHGISGRNPRRKSVHHSATQV